ncbi:hypothetical protein CP533_2615 [Ophiocordyceps camponoti-saundersi (nom. inval.)]|nr:hypothetical protein CP533_2615 [Ophiocordyceps camponoti-saundersi (nom. inval.)]
MKFFSINSLSLLLAGSLPLLGWAAQPVDEAPSWTLKQVTRIVPSENEVWLGFLIASEGYEPRWCYLLAHVDSPASEASFVNGRCVGSEFKVSWGYKKEEDAGIMTLANANGTRIAWFGWNDINKSTALADNGPNNTEATEPLLGNTQTPTDPDNNEAPVDADNTQVPTEVDGVQPPAEAEGTQTAAGEEDHKIVPGKDDGMELTPEEVADDEWKPVAFVA